MKILVLNGSPKRELSDTMRVTNAFLDGMNEAEPQQIGLIHVIDRHIEFVTVVFRACAAKSGAFTTTIWGRYLSKCFQATC